MSRIIESFVAIIWLAGGNQIAYGIAAQLMAGPTTFNTLLVCASCIGFKVVDAAKVQELQIRIDSKRLSFDPVKTRPPEMGLRKNTGFGVAIRDHPILPLIKGRL